MTQDKSSKENIVEFGRIGVLATDFEQFRELDDTPNRTQILA